MDKMSANDTQVGGDHYRAKDLQHWDLVRMYRWDYFQGQIIKYIMRWKTKHATHEKRLEDLRKARHFLDKYIEEEEREGDKEPVIFDWGTGGPELNDNEAFHRPSNPHHTVFSATYASNERFECDGGYGDGTQLYKCRKCKLNLRAASLAAARALHDCQAWAQEPSPTV